MNFQAKNLDAAYDTLSNLNALAINEGQHLIDDLKLLITNLKKDWKGNDAMLHINNLIDVYTGVATIVSNVKTIAHNASLSVVDAQELRNRYGGGGNVGTYITPGDDTIETLEKLGSTNEYFVDLVAVPNDSDNLAKANTNFIDFSAKFTRYKDELLNNWTSGSNHERAVSEFEQFQTDVARYKQIFKDVAENYAAAAEDFENKLGG